MRYLLNTAHIAIILIANFYGWVYGFGDVRFPRRGGRGEDDGWGRLRRPGPGTVPSRHP
jgi:hypothetical protein